jgi:hypothetical protein
LLVVWPAAFQLDALRHLDDWNVWQKQAVKK